MEVNAVVCELNPIHRGHKFIFDSAKTMFRQDSVNLAVMSGNFTQRCTPAIFDKYTRAEAAVRCGADIVVELPFPWCSSGVENFALGGVTVAAGLGATRLVFGSESGECDLLLKAAEVKESAEYREAVLKTEEGNRDLGSAAIFDVVMASFGISDQLGANDKLGMEYIRFGREQGIGEFYPITRLRDVKSATDLREMMFEDGIQACREHIPEAAFDLFDGAEICDEARYKDILFTYCRLRTNQTDNDILSYATRVARESSNAEDFLRSLPTKKYTAARLRREILHSMLGVCETKAPPRFTVLLAMNERGREYLSQNKKSFTLPVITKPADTDALDSVAREQYGIHLKADELYALCQNKPAAEYIKKHPRVL